MNKILKTWILLVFSLFVIYMVIVNRYIVFPEYEVKYDRWTGSLFQMKPVLTEAMQDTVPEKWDLAEISRLINEMLEQRMNREHPDILLTRLLKGVWERSDSLLEKKIDSLLIEADSMVTQLQKFEAADRLSKIVQKLHNRLEQYQNKSSE